MAELIETIKNQINSNDSAAQQTVHDDEFLYRSVSPGRGNLYNYEGGKLKLSSQAFNDKKYNQPSVDRAQLRNNDPKNSQLSPNDGIVSLLTKEIRNETVKINNPADPIQYALDVRPDPIDDNPAHAIIISSPLYKNDNAFRKVKIKLALLANKRGWLLEPKE